jgi:hypothetical protein
LAYEIDDDYDYDDDEDEDDEEEVCIFVCLLHNIYV